MQFKLLFSLALAAVTQAQVEQTVGPAVSAVETYIAGISATLAPLATVIPTTVFEQLTNPTLGPVLGGAIGVEHQAWFSELPESVQIVVASIADQESSIYVAKGGEATGTGSIETSNPSMSEVSVPTASQSVQSVKTESPTSAPPTSMTTFTQTGTSSSSSAKSSGKSKTKKGSAAKPTGVVAGAVMGLGGVLAGAALLI